MKNKDFTQATDQPLESSSLVGDNPWQATESFFIGYLRENSRFDEADQREARLVEKLRSAPHVAIALLANQSSIGEPAKDMLLSASYLSATEPSRLGHYCAAAKSNAIEALLDGSNEELCDAIARGLPKPPSPGQLARCLRHSPSADDVARRMARAKRIGFLTPELLRLLAKHSAWCDNHVGPMAQALLDQRTLARSIRVFQKPQSKARIGRI